MLQGGYINHTVSDSNQRSVLEVKILHKKSEHYNSLRSASYEVTATGPPHTQ